MKQVNMLVGKGEVGWDGEREGGGGCSIGRACELAYCEGCSVAVNSDGVWRGRTLHR